MVKKWLRNGKTTGKGWEMVKKWLGKWLRNGFKR